MSECEDLVSRIPVSEARPGVGYLMGRDAELDSYEVLFSPYGAGAGVLIVEAALELLREVG